MCGVLNFCHRICDVPAYEVPPQRQYAAMQIMRILLDDSIDQEKIARKRPLQVNRSSSFIVDLTNLRDVNDVKKDLYGKWLHSGSHTDVYKCWFDDGEDVQIEKATPLAIGSNVYKLRRLHSTHPSNPDFKRMIAFIFGRFVSCVILFVCFFLLLLLLLLLGFFFEGER